MQNRDGEEPGTHPLGVLRLTPSFEPPRTAIVGRGVQFDPIGGVQNHTAQLTRALDRLGVRHDVLTTRPPTAPLVQRVGDRSRVLRLGLPVAKWRQLYAAQAAPLALALGRKADVVHVHFTSDLGILPVAAAVARLHRLPLVVTVHCSLRHTLVLDSDHARRLHAYGSPVEHWIERTAAAVITLTPRLAGELVNDGIDPARVHVIPSGVDPQAFAGPWQDPFPDVPRPRIVYCGRLEPEKDVRTLVAALPLLRRTDAHLLLVGDGSQRAPLVEQAVQLGVGDRVHAPGYVHHDDVPAVLAHADVAVLPSVFEELGTAMLEALHMGVPFVASNVGGIPGVVTDGESGLLVPPGQPGAVAQAIDRILGDPALATRLADGARNAARGYQWPALARGVLDVYEGLVDRSASSPGPSVQAEAALG